MKNKGVFIAIFLILILGTFSTVTVRSYISGQRPEEEIALTSAAESGAESLETAYGDVGADLPAPAAAEGGADFSQPAGGQAESGAGAGNRSLRSAPAAAAAGDGLTSGSAAEGASQEAAPGGASAMDKAAGSVDAGSRDVGGDPTADSAGAVSGSRSASGAGARAEGMNPETAASGTAGPESGAAGQNGAGAVPEGTAGTADGGAASFAESEAESVLSPLSGTSSGTAAEETATEADYRRRFAEIDAAVEEMQTSEAVSNTDSLKNIADYEYRVWDGQLNRLYQAVIDGMTEREAEKLRQEERDWIRSRDQAAGKAAAKFKGGTMESLEYTASLASSTRERAYEILDTYGSYLPQKADG